METIDMGNSCSVVNTYVAELRDVNVQTDRMRCTFTSLSSAT